MQLEDEAQERRKYRLGSDRYRSPGRRRRPGVAPRNMAPARWRTDRGRQPHRRRRPAGYIRHAGHSLRQRRVRSAAPPGHRHRPRHWARRSSASSPALRRLPTTRQAGPAPGKSSTTPLPKTPRSPSKTTPAPPAALWPRSTGPSPGWPPPPSAPISTWETTPTTARTSSKQSMPSQTRSSPPI